MKLSSILVLMALWSLACPFHALAAEKFVLTATDGTRLVLKIYELDGNQIRTVNSTAIRNLSTFNTAVAFRKNNGTPTFDVYYGICQDIECVNAVLAMKRFDSKLNPTLENDHLFRPVRFSSYVDLTTERVVEPDGLSLRLLFSNNGVIAERRLLPDGTLGAPAAVAFRGQFFGYSAADDGRMVAASDWGTNSIQVRTFHPAGTVRTLQTKTNPFSMTLSGPIATAVQSPSAGSIAQKHRFLLYRVWPAQEVSQIIIQKIDDATGSFIGKPKPFAHSRLSGGDYWLEWYKSMVISPRANVVFYTAVDSCGLETVSAQVIDPQKGTKIGAPQLLIGCGETQHSISGLDVAEFQP